MEDYNGTATNERLGALFNMMEEGDLILDPSFQRNLVWNDLHKEKFIETILKKYPFPEVYFSEGEVNLETKKPKMIVVDGQQRLDAIRRYILGDLSLKTISPYIKLKSKQQKDFLRYKVIVRDFGDIDNKSIKEIFKRINSVGYALNAMEINNALYDGDFILVAQNVSEKKELEELPVFAESQISRMKDAEFFLQVMTAIEMNGYFRGNDQVEELIIEYNDTYPNKKKMALNLLDTIKIILKLKLERDSMWFRKSNFFTLMVELINYNKNHKDPLEGNKLKTKLNKFEEFVEKNKDKGIEESIYSMYYYYTYQGTNSKKGRMTRGEILEFFFQK